MPEIRRLTAAEAAFVLDEPPKAVKKALDEGPIEAAKVRLRGMTVRMLDRTDVVYLYALRLFRNELTPTARTELYRAMKRKLAAHVAFGRLRLDISDALAAVDTRLERLAKLKDSVEFRDDGEPVVKGMDIEVHRIAALLTGGMSAEHVMEDFPGLTLGQVEAAREFAAAHPKPGRPYPKTTLKRLLRKSGLHELDEVLGDE